MKNLFEQSRSHWVRYDRYELKTAADGKRYVTPAKDARKAVRHTGERREARCV